MEPLEPQPAITKDEARAWEARWRAVNDHDIHEARGQTIEERFCEFAALFDSMRGGDNDDEPLREVNSARARWTRLKERLLER